MDRRTFLADGLAAVALTDAGRLRPVAAPVGSAYVTASPGTDFVTVGAPEVVFDPGFTVLDGTRSGTLGFLWGDSLSPVDGELYGWRSGSIDSDGRSTPGHLPDHRDPAVPLGHPRLEPEQRRPNRRVLLPALQLGY